MHTEIFVRHENVVRTCANWFKQFKNSDFVISDKECWCPTAVKENDLRKDGKQ